MGHQQNCRTCKYGQNQRCSTSDCKQFK